MPRLRESFLEEMLAELDRDQNAVFAVKFMWCMGIDTKDIAVVHRKTFLTAPTAAGTLQKQIQLEIGMQMTAQVSDTMDLYLDGDILIKK